MAATRPQATAPRKAPDIGLSAAVARTEGVPGREGWVGTVRGALELPDMRRIELGYGLSPGSISSSLCRRINRAGASSYGGCRPPRTTVSGRRHLAWVALVAVVVMQSGSLLVARERHGRAPQDLR
jgi:hypothetical protein